MTEIVFAHRLRADYYLRRNDPEPVGYAGQYRQRSGIATSSLSDAYLYKTRSRAEQSCPDEYDVVEVHAEIVETRATGCT